MGRAGLCHYAGIRARRKRLRGARPAGSRQTHDAGIVSPGFGGRLLARSDVAPGAFEDRISDLKAACGPHMPLISRTHRKRGRPEEDR